MKKISLSTFLIVILCLSIYSVTSAQTDEIGTTTTTPDITAQPTDGIFDCFEKYNFGSVKIESSVSSPNAHTGTLFSVPLVVTNTNNYPIVNGAVYVKVLKYDDNNVNYSKGPAVVKQIYLAKNLTLAAHQSKTINFSWQVPVYLTSGKYYLASYFVANDKFNYSGLSFTNDVVGGLMSFNIKGENADTIYLNKDNIKVNGSVYNPAAFAAQINDGKPADIQVEIVSKSKNTERFPVTWYVYSWDGLSEENLVFSKQDGAFLQPGEKKVLTLTIPDNKYPVYYVVAKGEYKDTESILDIRYSRNDASLIRLNSASIVNYPIRAGMENQIYACFHSAGLSSVDNVKLIISLKDSKGNLVTENTYTGSVSSDVTGFRKIFTHDKDLYNFTLESNLYRDDKLVDSASVKYVCNDLQVVGCPIEVTSESQSFLSKLFNPIYLIIGLFIALLLVIGFIIFKKYKNNNL